MTATDLAAPPAETAALPASPDPNHQWVEPFAGIGYYEVLRSIHAHLQPKSYLEIGVNAGNALALASCPTIGIDPDLSKLAKGIGTKLCQLLFQSGSDAFFANYSPTTLLNKPHIDFCFLDGMHLFEFLVRDFMNAERHAAPNSIIALHDCLPLDLHMTLRVQGEASPYLAKHDVAMWTGDVYRILPILRKYRPDLRIHTVATPPTGLVLITGLNPGSPVLADRYHEIVAEGLAFDLAAHGLARFHADQNILPATEFTSFAKLSQRFWL